MLCSPAPNALPLLRCVGEDPKIYIGASAYNLTDVRVRSLATGRVTQYPLSSDADGYYFEPDGEVILDHTYEVTAYVDGVQVPFRPYAATGYSLNPTATAYNAVRVTFEDVVGEVGDEQFLTLEA